MIRFVVAWLAIAVAPAFGVAHAQPVAERAVRVIVPYAAGGVSDVFARRFAMALTSSTGQTVIVDNRPGGNTAVGSELVAKAPPDGATLGVIGLNAPWIQAAAGGTAADALRGFTPIAMLAESVWIVVVPASSKATTLRELVELARASRGAMNYASGGFGTFSHLSASSILARAGVELQHVPYKGESEVIAALLREEVGMASLSTPTVIEHVRAGRLRALASTGRARSRAFPDLPTVAETLPGADQTGFIGLFGPANLSPAAVAALNAAVDAMMAAPETRERLAATDSTHVALSPDAFRDYVGSALDHWASLVRQGRLRLD